MTSPSVDSSLSFIRPPTPPSAPRRRDRALEPPRVSFGLRTHRRYKEHITEPTGERLPGTPPEMDTVLDLHVDPVMATSHRQKRDR
jgi:hypothetical protein